MKTNLTSKKPCTYPCTRKLFFTILIIFSELMLKSQTLTTFYFGNNDNNYIELHTMMETRDGNIIMNCPIFGEENNSFVDLGYYLCKVSPQGELLDSVFVEDNDIMHYILDRNPLNEDNNIIATIVRNFEDTTSTLKIMFFDDNLEIQDEKNVPLQDTIVKIDSYYIDPNNDLIVSYSASKRFYMLRVGLDGTLKDKVKLPAVDFNYISIRHIGLYNESPLEYCIWGSNLASGLTIYKAVVDSALNFIDQTHFSSIYQGGNNEQIMYFNDSTYILSSFHEKMNYPFNGGVHLSKFNKNNECLDTVLFIEDETNLPFPIWAEKGADGGIYYSYVTNAFGKQVAVVKMDDNFNIYWKRYCLDPGPFHWGFCMKALSNGDVAVGGFDSSSGHGYYKAFLLILNNDGSSTPEMADFVKPYLVYPNPCKDKINIHISPDIAFEKAELYDMSGRLVKAQESSFENININGIASGTYILKLKTQDGKVYDEKVVVE